MLGSITPLGERGRGSMWAVTVVALIVGSSLAGAAMGLALGSVAYLLPPSLSVTSHPRAATLVLAAWVLVSLLLHAGLFDLRLPTVHRQVNDAWLGTYRGWVYGLGFGTQLGVGVATIVRGPATYSAFFSAFLLGSPLLGMLVGATFGLTRGLSVLLVARVHGSGQLAHVALVLGKLEAAEARLSSVAQFAIAFWVFTAAIYSLRT